jgi:cohesin complex subunit SA-1/2
MTQTTLPSLASQMRTMFRPRMKTNTRAMARRSLGESPPLWPRRRASREQANARVSQRMESSRRPLASQRKLRQMATRRTRTKSLKTSKLTQTTRFSVRYRHPSRSVLFTHTPVKDAIMNPSAALQSTVEDFLETLKETPEAAQAELVNCILRACGCNDSVNQDEAVDHDGVVDALDNFTEALKQVRRTTLLPLLLNIPFPRMIRPYTP